MYRDASIVTQHDAHGMPTSSSSQPAIMAQMLERLDVREGQRVLEIGAGTGYNAALLATLVGARGRVVSVELDPRTAGAARKALAAASYRARVVTGDGREGVPGAPYDRIMVTASTDEICRPWIEQLAEGGLLEAPLRLKDDAAQAVATLRKEDGRLRSVAVVAGGFVPLRGGVALPPPRQVSVNETVDWRLDSILQLRGSAVARLSRAARRRLVTIALSTPRTRRLDRGRSDSLPTVFLSLATPAGQEVHGWIGSFERRGVGVVSRTGASLALVRGDRIDAYGGGEAEELLLGRLEEWKARGRPTEQDLSIEVDYRADSPRLRWRWPAPGR